MHFFFPYALNCFLINPTSHGCDRLQGGREPSKEACFGGAGVDGQKEMASKATLCKLLAPADPFILHMIPGNG